MIRFVFFICFLVSIHAFAQKIKVVNSYTQESIEGAVVECVQSGTKKVTNPRGIAELKKEMGQLYIYHLNYDTLKLKKTDLTPKVQLKPKYEGLQKIVLSASRTAEKKHKIPEHIEMLTQKNIDQISAQTSADLLAQIPGVRVQKSQFGGGSPVIRGMESNRILLVVDGVRMNNAIYRKGHLQNSITVSPLAIERAEVVFGPTSVAYGSDALGGVIHYYTKKLSYHENPELKNQLFYRHSTVNNEHSVGFDSYTSHQKWASYTNVSFNSFGDLKMGENRLHNYPNWGKVNRYSQNTETDYYNNSTVNKNPNVQKNTGYKQWDVLQKFMFPIHKDIDLVINGQYSNTSNIPNFGKLNDEKSGDLKFAEWSYGPQKRMLISAQAQFNGYQSLLENGTITLAYQDVEESRINRQFGSKDRTSRFEEVTIFSLNSDFYKSLTRDGKRKLFYGLEWMHNDVQSTAKGETLSVMNNKITGVESNYAVDTRYPDGGSTYSSAALYTSYRQQLDEKHILNFGLRFTHTLLTADWDKNVAIPIPDNFIRLNNTALTGSVGYIYKPDEDDKISVVISKGFRSPNVDDVGKIRSKSSKLTVPNTQLEPEHLYSFETGYSKMFANNKGDVNLNVYYTLLDNYIARYATDEFGSRIEYDGDVFENEAILANTNLGKAYVYGATLSAMLPVYNNIKSQLSATYTKGKSYDFGESLSSIPPFYGHVSLGMYKPKYTMTLDCRFSFRKQLKDYNITEGIDNLDETPFEHGTPSWYVFDFNTQYFLFPFLRLQLQWQNILDVHYKEFGSSISAPGRNIAASVAYSF